MMPIAQFSALLLVAIALAGCNFGNPDAYVPGTDHCSDRFMNDYYAIGEALSGAEAVWEIDRAQSKVDRFASDYSGVSCRTGTEAADSNPFASGSWLTADDLVRGWNRQIGALRGYPQPAPSPVDPADAAVSSLKDGIWLAIGDPDAFFRLTTEGAGTIIQRGWVTGQAFLDDADYCRISGNALERRFSRGERIHFRTYVDSSKLVGFETGGTLYLECGKLHDPTISWKLRDLSEVFGGVANITARD